MRGFAFNRRHFHTKIDALVSCILWSNSDEKLDTISLKAYNIIDNKIFQEEDLTVNRIYTKYSNVFYDKRKFTDDRYSDFVLGLNGAEYFPLRKDNYLQKLPMLAASRYITYNRHWTQRANIMKSADGAEKFNNPELNGHLNTLKTMVKEYYNSEIVPFLFEYDFLK